MSRHVNNLFYNMSTFTLTICSNAVVEPYTRAMDDAATATVDPANVSQLAMIRTTRSVTAAREAILGAPERLLAEQPLQDLTASRIIAAAGVSRPNFYQHYPSKYAVVAELLGRVLEQFNATIADWTHGEDPASRDRLAHIVTRIGENWFE